MLYETSFILTKTVKFKRGLILLSALLLCLGLQFLIISHPYEKLLESYETRTQETQTVGTVESSSIKLSGITSTYQNFRVDEKTVTLATSENYEIGQEVPIWKHELNDKTVISSSATSTTDNVLYSLSNLEIQEPIANSSLMNIFALMLTILNFVFFCFIITFIVLLIRTKEVKDPHRAFGSKKERFREINYLPSVVDTAGIFVTHGILGMFLMATIFYIFLSYESWEVSLSAVSGSNWALIFLAALLVSLVASFIFNINGKIQTVCEHYFVKFAWGFNFYNLNVSQELWYSERFKEKLNKWFLKDDVDLEVVDSLKESFSGTLKELKETAKAFGPDVN